MASKKRFYILFVSRDEEGNLSKVPVPLHYAYSFVAAAAIGMFTITGMAGSYSRMLIKTARFNQLRTDHDALRKDYANLEKQAHEKDIQAASLGSLASEVSALYGLTTSKLTLSIPGRKSKAGVKDADVAKSAGTAPLTDLAATNYTDDSYYKSVDAFYTLRTSAMSGNAARLIATPLELDHLDAPIHLGRALGPAIGMDGGNIADGPSLWPVVGEISSSFGQREDPVLGNGEGEFHPGVDIRAELGTPIHATADGVVKMAEMTNGYGREVIIDHGHGLETCYGHMSGFAVTAGQTVTKGEVIGFVGHSGRTTGNHVHYEVRIHNTPVNPHKYLRVTLAQLGSEVATK
ncbi:Peptidase family M23 [Granulicella rosea]|uniref:Peptidase family M23 n=1 Tax=Granulicella rosea TaxID=474952 RepID=A0A239KWP7_9BACT|nr:M23 family metallopeptidase [Granulicella rosea]SNT22430.1 Peptidase family M23 [Granulicella rosea]